MKLSANQKGYSTELDVAARLIRLGYGVSFPFMPLKYDLIADFNGLFNRLQIKFSSQRRKSNKESVRFCIKSAKDSSKFVDYFILICDSDAWILPANLCTTTNIRMTPGGKYEPFRNNWDILRSSRIV